MARLKAPDNLHQATRRWWLSVAREHGLDADALRILSIAAENWDLSRQAHEVIIDQGTTYTDRYGQPRARPETTIYRQSVAAFTRAMRLLSLESEKPEGEKPEIEFK